EGEDGLKAVIETVDPKAKTLTALGIKVVASDATVLQGENHEQVSFSAIRPGRRVSAKGTFRGDATLVASKLTIRPEKPEKARDVVNFPFHPEDAEASERARFERYLSLPFKGKEPPTEAEAETFLAFVRDPQHWPVHIHCKEGKYRTGLMAALVRYAIDGWSIDEALAEARQGQGPVRAGRQLAPPLGCQSRARQLRPP